MLQKFTQMVHRWIGNHQVADSGSRSTVGVEQREACVALKDSGDQYFKKRMWHEAEHDYQQSLALNPNQCEIYKNLGVIQYYAGRFAQAVEYYHQALSLKADYPEALSNRGLAYYDMFELELALTDLNAAIELKPNFAAAYNNRGLVFKKLGKLETALQDFNQAIRINPDYAQAYKNRGDLFKELKDPKLALQNYARAMQISPDIDMDFGLFLEQKSLLCDWSDYNSQLQQFHALITSGKLVQPLTVLWHIQSAAMIRQAAEKYISTYCLRDSTVINLPKLPKHQKIRVAYFCGEFYQHAVVFLMAGLFEKHDKDRFETYAFSFSAYQDAATARIKPAFDAFIDVSSKSDEEVLVLAHEMELDIAVDLNGITGNARPGLFSNRLAPLQVNYLGYPGTLGVPYMDYIFADTVVIPPTHVAFYAEKVAYLPCFQVNDSRRMIADQPSSRRDVGLPQQAFVYCSFNNISKITPHMFDVWMEILRNVEHSVLWLLGESEAAKSNLRHEAMARGVDAGRLVFAGQMSYDEHLARYRLADLFLDTLPFNAGTTASDALWAGLPVLTQVGEAFSSRMGASLLSAVGLPELITETTEAYAELAIHLGHHPQQVDALKAKLAAQRLSSPLFDTVATTRQIESLYTQMYERYHADLAPDHLYAVSD